MERATCRGEEDEDWKDKKGEGREVESSVWRGDADSSIWRNSSGGCEVPLRVPV